MEINYCKVRRKRSGGRRYNWAWRRATYENDGVLLGGRGRDCDGRASDVREVDLFGIAFSSGKGRSRTRKKEHTAVALKSILADFESGLAVLFGDAARTTHNGRFLWRGLGGGCGDEGEDVFTAVLTYNRASVVIVRHEKVPLPPAPWSSCSSTSSAIALFSWSYSASMEPQLWAPAPPLGVELSMPLRASERSLTRARREWERSVRVMIV